MAATAGLIPRASFAASVGQFKDLEMTQPLQAKQSFLIALLGCVQAALPAVVVLFALDVTLWAFQAPFDASSPALVIVGLLSWLFFRPTHKRRSPLVPARVSTAAEVLLRWLLLLTVLWVIGLVDADSPLHEYPRLARMAWAIGTPLALVLMTLAVQDVRRRLLISIFDNRTAIIVGYNSSALKLASRLQGNPSMRLAVAGFFDDRSQSLSRVEPDAAILGNLNDLAGYVKKHRTDVIFVALPNRDVDLVMKIMDELGDTTASIYYVPDSLAFDHVQQRSDQVHGIPVIAMCESPLYGFRGVGKRLTDVGLALLALVLLLPLMSAIAGMVKLSSPGPVIYKQRRYGLEGRMIAIYKFRTAPIETGARQPPMPRGGNRIGDFLRRSALDELPQLFNVLQGRMSLVGPQPHAVAQGEQYRKLVKGYMVRHKVLPGITGLAQVNARIDTAEQIQDVKAHVNLDLDYLQHWSPTLDLKIMFLTFANFLRGHSNSGEAPI